MTSPDIMDLDSDVMQVPQFKRYYLVEGHKVFGIGSRTPDDQYITQSLISNFVFVDDNVEVMRNRFGYGPTLVWVD